MVSDINGVYTLAEAYSDTPVDLNFDGVSSVNMMEEMDCQIFFPLFGYKATINNFQYNSSIELMVEIPYAEVLWKEEPYQQCFVQGLLIYRNIEVDFDSRTISTAQPEIKKLRMVEWLPAGILEMMYSILLLQKSFLLQKGGNQYL